MRPMLAAVMAAAAAFAAGDCVAQPSVQERAAAMRQAQARRDPRRLTLERLMTPVTVDLKDARLEDVLTFVAQTADIEVDTAWNDGGLDGLDRDARVTVAVRDKALLSLVEAVLEKAPGGSEANTWQLGRGGEFEVGPKSRLNKRATLKIYDISDMVFVQPDFPQVPELSLDTVLQQGSQRGGGGSSAGGIFNQRETNNTDQILRDERQRADDIVALIVQNVEPAQWDRNGGDGATVRLQDNSLLIKAPDYIHRQIGGYPFWPSSR